MLFEDLFQEDLNSRMPHLLRQFPEYGEDFIRQVAQADPTGPRATYVTWLLRMLRAGEWEVTDAPDMLNWLLEYDRLKQLTTFPDETNIDLIQSVEDGDSSLISIVSRNRELKSSADAAKQRAETGARNLNEVGVYSLWAVTTPEAATKFGRGKGGLEAPTTVWCTKNAKTALDYLSAGPLYVVVKEGDSYVQFHFQRQEAKDARNLPLQAAQGLEIGPVCAVLAAEFEAAGFTYKPGGYFLSDEDIARYLERSMKPKFIAQRYNGFHKNGIWQEPVKDVAVLEDRWARASVYFRQTLVTARETNDIELIKKAGHREPEATSLQAIYNGVYEHAHPQPA